MRNHPLRALLVVVAIGAAGLGLTACSPTAINAPMRPNGLSQLNATFGNRCSTAASAGGQNWPWGNVWSGSTYKVGYVKHHAKLANTYMVLEYAIIGPYGDNMPFAQAVGNFNCRQIAGSSSWSVHSWGVAYDVNSGRNPRGQGHWNGVASTGVNHGNEIPDAFQADAFVHYWGLNFSNPDPMHFQYVTGY
jgi:hypothetical protein